MNPITIPANELKSALSGLNKVIPRRSSLPVLGCIRVERTATGSIELAATDLNSTAVVKLDTPTQGEATAFLLKHDDLVNLTKSCGRDDYLIIAQLSPNRVAIRFPMAGQVIEHQCDAYPIEEFPPTPSVAGERIPIEDSLRQSILAAFSSSSNDSSRLILNGVCLDVSDKHGHYVVATDGRQLFSSNSFKLPLQQSLILPNNRFVGCKEFMNDGDWTLAVDKSQGQEAPRFELASPRWRYHSRSLDGNYPNWRQVVPDAGQIRTTIEIAPEATDALIQTIARLPDHDSVNHTIGIKAHGARLWLLSKSAGAEQWRELEVTGAKVRGESVTAFINRQFLVKAVRLGLNRIDIVDHVTPVKFSNGGRQLVVLPMRQGSTPTAAVTAPLGSAEPETNVTTARNQTANQIEPMQQSTASQPRISAAITSNGHQESEKSSAPEKPALESALAQIESVKGEFRNCVTGLTKVADFLKQAQREQKASEREIQNIRQTLRSLQSVRI